MLRRVDTDTKMSVADSKVSAGTSNPEITEVRPPLKQKRTLSMCHMILLNAIVFGIEVCACAGFTYVTPILLKAGFSEEKMTFLLGVGPFLGIFIVPIIGQSSDNCRSPFGRRRPFIFVIGVTCILSLIIIPYSASMSYKLGNVMNYPKFISLFLLAVGVVILDFTTSVGLNPCEALLSDLSADTNESNRIFIVYSTMISIGGCVGYLITALDWMSSPLSSFMGGQEQCIFSILLLVFTSSMFITLCSAKEKRLLSTNAPNAALTASHESGYESSSDETPDRNEGGRSASLSNKPRVNWQPKILTKTSLPQYISQINRTIFSVVKLISLAICRVVSSLLCAGIRKKLQKLCAKMHKKITRILSIPIVLRYLALADMLSWMNIMCFTYFFSDFMGQMVYGGSPNADDDSTVALLYDQGVRAASWGLLLHCIVAAIYAPIVERLMYAYGSRRTLTVSIAVGTIAMVMICIARTPIIAICLAAITGFGNAALTIIPYTLMTEYHSDKQLYFYDAPQLSAAEQDDERGIAGDFAILDCSYFIAEVALAVTMGYIVQYSGTTLAYIIAASLLGIVACITVQQVVTNKDEMKCLIHKCSSHSPTASSIII